jgi:hypothetical protein
MSPGAESKPTIYQALHKQWCDVAVYRQGLEEQLASVSAQEASEAFKQLLAKSDAYDQLLEAQINVFREVMGAHFLGPAEWHKGFGLQVSKPPPIPEYITEEFLDSTSPLHPDKKIRDTHLLVLIPKSLGGNDYSLVNLESICRESSRVTLHVPSSLEKYAWATRSCARVHWILLPKTLDSLDGEDGKRGFRGKPDAEQWNLCKREYRELFRGARVLEVVTALALYQALHDKLPILHGEGFRCLEKNGFGSSLSVTRIDEAVWINHLLDDDAYSGIGLAVIWRERTPSASKEQELRL